MLRERLARPAGYTHGKAAKKVAQGPGGMITSPTFHAPVLVGSQQNYLRFTVGHEASLVLLELLPPRGKAGRKINDKNEYPRLHTR